MDPRRGQGGDGRDEALAPRRRARRRCRRRHRGHRGHRGHGGHGRHGDTATRGRCSGGLLVRAVSRGRRLCTRCTPMQSSRCGRYCMCCQARSEQHARAAHSRQPSSFSQWRGRLARRLPILRALAQVHARVPCLAVCVIADGGLAVGVVPKHATTRSKRRAETGVPCRRIGHDWIGGSPRAYQTDVWVNGTAVHERSVGVALAHLLAPLHVNAGCTAFMARRFRSSTSALTLSPSAARRPHRRTVASRACDATFQNVRVCVCVGEYVCVCACVRLPDAGACAPPTRQISREPRLAGLWSA